MEDRYELCGKISQGGAGRAHRAYDHKMRRKLAMKRILRDTSARFTSPANKAGKRRFRGVHHKSQAHVR